MIRFIYILLFSMAMPVTANIDIEFFSNSELIDVEDRKSRGVYGNAESLAGTNEDPIKTYKDDYRELIDSIRMPTVNLDALTIEGSFPKLGSGGVDYSAVVVPQYIADSKYPIADIWSSEAIAYRKQNYLAQRCNNESDRIMANAGGMVFSTNFSGVVDGWIRGISNAENEIKSQVSGQVSNFFQNISRMLSPGYVIEQAVGAFATGMAEFTCGNCQKTKLGCGNQFLIAEISKYPKTQATYEKLGIDVGSVTISETQEGSYLEVNVGSAKCPSTNIIKGLAGIVKGSGVHTKKEASSKVDKMVDEGEATLDANTMNACVIAERKLILDIIKDAINASRGSLRAVVETQDACFIENSQKINLYEKSDYSKEEEDNYFDKINNFIETQVNDPGQKFTNTVMDNIDAGIKIINKTKSETDIRNEISKVLKIREGALSQTITQLDKYDFIQKKIIDSPDSTIIKDITSLMMDDIFIVSQMSILSQKDFTRLIECRDSSLRVEGSVTGFEIDCVNSNKVLTEKEKKKVFEIRDEFYTDLDFYNKEFMDSLTAGVPTSSSLMCSEFDVPTADDVNRCHDLSYIEHLTGIKPSEFDPDATKAPCECNNYDMLLDLVPNPYTTAKILLNSQGLSALPKPPKGATGSGYLDDLNSSVDHLKGIFIMNAAARISMVQSRQNRYLYQVGLNSQSIIRDRLKEYFGLMRN
jgi:hypothetical protein